MSPVNISTLTVDIQNSLGRYSYWLMKKGLQSLEGSPAQVFLGVPVRQRINLPLSTPNLSFSGAAFQHENPKSLPLFHVPCERLCPSQGATFLCSQSSQSLKTQSFAHCWSWKESLTNALGSDLTLPLEKPSSSHKNHANIMAFLIKAAPSAFSSTSLY